MVLTTARTSVIRELAQLGQSLWLDNLRRQLITSGELARLQDAGITGDGAQGPVAHHARQDAVPAGEQSGETVETLSHFAYFWEAVSKVAPRTTGRQFAAITDPGTPLEQLALEHEFRWLFQAPPDIGGRYSALSYFGLVPGALLGIDVATLLQRAVEMMHTCDACVPVAQNPGAWLGGVLGQLGSTGRDKITLVLSPRIETFGYWVEQLLAESTGKRGKGLIPIEGEPLGLPNAYGQDRLFLYVRLADDPHHAGVQALEQAGQPVATLTLRDKFDLGGEFLRWEIATAVAGSILGIDPFDQPNVQESKDNTRAVLSRLSATGSLPDVENHGRRSCRACHCRTPQAQGRGLLPRADGLHGQDCRLRARAGPYPKRGARPAHDRHHRRLWTTLSALDGPAAQRRTAGRAVRADRQG